MGSLPPHRCGRGESSLRGAPVTCATRISATKANQTSEVPPADSATPSSGSDAGPVPRVCASGHRACAPGSGPLNREQSPRFPASSRSRGSAQHPRTQPRSPGSSCRRPALTAPPLPAPAQPPPAVPAPPSLRRTAGQGRDLRRRQAESEVSSQRKFTLDKPAAGTSAAEVGSALCGNEVILPSPGCAQITDQSFPFPSSGA
ncbi:zinc finger protein ZIC 5-like [Apodemus sylvaticus]|uniref:zinc finger protein ZIC 5-like n=1 Tax=Apodemus sylvaticus TaxID=10129 RepID=UPI002244052E|nr:zinc finger protein ZIC 5-like [Apodemus sylvaticus]XP_052036241.1 zinc finger protein ZIC 5-like [Apodemus sylvaticus]